MSDVTLTVDESDRIASAMWMAYRAGLVQSNSVAHAIKPTIQDIIAARVEAAVEAERERWIATCVGETYCAKAESGWVAGVLEPDL
jgi:hypothetical protein